MVKIGDELSRWIDITYTFYDGLFFHYTSLKNISIAKAIQIFFALSSKKIASVKKGDYFYPPTDFQTKLVDVFNFSLFEEQKWGLMLIFDK